MSSSSDDAARTGHRPAVRLIERAAGRFHYACPTCGGQYHFYDEAMECAWSHRLAHTRRNTPLSGQDR